MLVTKKELIFVRNNSVSIAKRLVLAFTITTTTFGSGLNFFPIRLKFEINPFGHIFVKKFWTGFAFTVFP